MSNASDPYSRTEIRDGMRITWHQPIRVDDGLVLRGDVYRPVADGRYPVILNYGIYGKGLAYQDGYPLQWRKWSPTTRRSWRARPTSIRTGKQPIRSGGSRTAT